jgi:PAS domain S-box-containing protein
MLNQVLSLICSPHPSLRDSELDPERIFDSLDTAILVIDENGRIMTANQRWKHLSRGRLSMLFHEYLHPSDRALWQQAMLRLDQSVCLRLLTTEHCTSCWYELELSSLNKDSGWPRTITLIDISSRMDEARQREAHWRSMHQLLQHLPAMLYRGRNNRHWTMEYVSAGCRDLTGYSPEVLTNQSCLNYGDLIHPDDSGPVWEQAQDALSRRSEFELHYRLQHAEGHLVPVSEKGCGLYADNGSILGVEGIVIAFATPPDYPRI